MSEISEYINTASYRNISLVPDGDQLLSTFPTTLDVENHENDDAVINIIDYAENSVVTQPLEFLEKNVNEDRKVKPRKRRRNPSKWEANLRKEKHQSGQKYISKRGKHVEARSIVNKKNCLENCKYNCQKQISTENRLSLFKSYWRMAQNEKYIFLNQTTRKAIKARNTKEGSSRRKFSYTYYFKVNGEDIRVCKDYFLGTLNISQKPIYTAHSQINSTPKKDNRGKDSTRAISVQRKGEVIEHINKFPVIESHYCRQKTNRKYLEANLSVRKMYDLYKNWCNDNGKDPVLLTMYRHIFVTEFNYGFHVPKTDRCIKCESYKIKQRDNMLSNEEVRQFEEHSNKKNVMRQDRNKDRDNKLPVLSFDLENVITCPRSEVGEFFYLQKLNIYNLTAVLSPSKTVYCAIWTEVQQGRTGNCIASAFRKILNRVLEDHNIMDIITWSDSCVPQNRNAFISYAVMDALKTYPELQSLTMKYSVPGHGAIQEVDSIHSTIERHMNKAEFYSPLSFIKELKLVNKRKPYVILQMKDEDFLDFEDCASKFAYKKVPFSKVSSLKFTQNLSEVEYKTNHSEKSFTMVSLRNEMVLGTRCNRDKVRTRGGGRVKTRGGGQVRHVNGDSLIMTTKPKVLPSNRFLSANKIAAIKRMITSCMPQLDKVYFNAVLNSLKS